MLGHRWDQEALWERHPAWFIVVLAAISASLVRPASGDDAKQIARGRELFTRVWRPNDPECHGGDGLGPRYNDRSCVACHHQHGIGGGGPLSKNVQIFNADSLPESSPNLGTEQAQIEFLFPGIKELPFVLQRSSTARGYLTWRAEMLTKLVEVSNYYMPTKSGTVMKLDESQLNNLRLDDLDRRGFNQTHTFVGPNSYLIRRNDIDDLLPVLMDERNATSLFGAGVIDAIPAETIEATAATQPAQFRGRARPLPDGKLGRFGWQSQIATLADFNTTACAVELGLDNPSHRQQWLALDPDYSNDTLDLTQQDCDALTAFVASLPTPRQIVADRYGRDVAVGEQLFNSIGCVQCHVRDLGPAQGIYSDLLLHQIGMHVVGPRNKRQESAIVLAPERGAPLLFDEWRTPPLWGCADSAPYMHNGMAPTLGAAILAHHGQGRSAAIAFEKLHPEEKRQLLAFLQSLRAPSSAEKAPQAVGQK